MTSLDLDSATPDVGQGSRSRFARFVPALILALVAYVPSFMARPGWVAADTKAYLYLNPSKLLSSAWSMWNPDIALGTVTHQNIGYLFPMGPYFWATNALGIPVWAAQRFWMGSLFFAAGLGFYCFSRLLGLRRRGALAGAFVYMLTPFVLDYITRISAITMPWAALGWMLCCTALALRRGGWRYPALFALCVAIVGGVNATSILFVGLAPTLYLLYAITSTKEASSRAAIRVIGKIGLLTTMVSLWWIAGLWAEGAYGINILKFTETIPTVTSTSLASEAFRGLGYWFFYGRDVSEPWTSAAVPYVSSYWAIALSFAIPTACLLAGMLVKWRYRAFAVWVTVLGIVLAVAAYPLTKPTPFGSALKAAAESSTVGLAMRSSNRVLPIAVLGLGLLLGAFISAVVDRKPRYGTWLLIATFVATSANLSPLFNGSIVATNNARSSAKFPQSVTDTANYLNSIHQGTNVLGVPGEDFAYYTFGTTSDPIWPGLLNRPYLARQAVVQGEPASANLLRAFDEAIQNGTLPASALAPTASLMGSGDLLLQSNLPTNRYSLNQPQVLYLNLFNPTPPGLASPVSFGDPSEVAAIKRKVYGPEDLAIPPGSPYPAPLMVYGVTSPRSELRFESVRSPFLVAGDGQGLVDMAGLGLLPSNAAITYSGSLSAKSTVLAQALQNNATLILTDSNVRSLDSWGTLDSTFGYPMMANEKPLVDNPAQQSLSPFDNKSSDLQTVAVYPGVTQMAATSYGNPITNNPENQAASAFDGNQRTAWIEGAYQSAVNQTIYLGLDHEITTDHLDLLQPSLEDSGIRRITKITVHLDNFRKSFTLNDSSIAINGRASIGQRVEFGPRRFSHLSITVDATNQPGLTDFSRANAVGFAEVGIDQVTPIHESLRLPTDLTKKVGTSAINHPMVIVLNRSTLRFHGLNRLVKLENGRSFAGSGLLHMNNEASDTVINALLQRTGPLAQRATSGVSVIGTDSTSRLPSTVNAGSWSAVDGNASTAWVPENSLAAGQAMTVNLASPVTVDHLNLDVVNDYHHSLPSEISLSNGLQTVTVSMPQIPPPASQINGSTSAVTVPLPTALTGTNFTFTVTKKVAPKVIDFSKFGPASLPFGIAELGLPGVVAPQTPTTITIPCRNDLLSVNGIPVPVTATGSVAALTGSAGIRYTTCNLTPFVKGTNSIVGTRSIEVPLTVDLAAFGSAAGGGPMAFTGTNLQLTDAPAAPSLTLHHDKRTLLTGTLIGTGEPGTLVLGQSLSSGWRLSVDGVILKPGPRLVDGFANGWDLPSLAAGTHHEVRLEWMPQRTVDFALYASFFGFLVVLGLIVLPRRRKSRPVAAHVAAPSLLSRSTSLKTIGRPRIVGIVGGIVIATLITAWWAILPLSLAAVVMVRLRKGRLIVAALTGAALVLATASVTLQAHAWPWNILWPQHFGVANAAVWCALGLVFLDVTIEHSALRHAETDPETPPIASEDDNSGDGPGHGELEESDVASDRLLEDPDATAPLLGADTNESHFPLDPTREPADFNLHLDDLLAVGTSAFDAASPTLIPGATGAILAGVAAGEALAASTPEPSASKAERPRQDPEAESEEIPLALPTGIRRSIALFRVFRVEQTDPDRFYRTLAEDTANQLASYAPLFNRTIVDVGGGPGYFSEAFESRGAKVILVEPDARPLEPRDPSMPFASFEERHDYAVIPGRLHEGRTISGDGMRLPFADNSVDISFSSNVLEHVPDPSAFFDEALRITKPNGTVYCSFTVWSSPWGGHETSPWHHFGGEYAARRYEKKHGRPPGNRFGSSLFKVRVKDALKLVKERKDVSLVWAFPRYYPEWASWIIRVPILREFGTWNLLLILRKDVSVNDDAAARPPLQGLGRPPQQFGPSESASRFQAPRD
jgi:arabinofuranan 3-O-arabinosyltransferase